MHAQSHFQDGSNVGSIGLEQSWSFPFFVKGDIHQLMSFQQKISSSTRVLGFPASGHYSNVIIILNPPKKEV